MNRRSTSLLALVAALSLVALGCSSDDDAGEDTTTTEATGTSEDAAVACDPADPPTLEDGKLVWYDRIGEQDRRSTTEPDASTWRRIGVNLLRALPIESQL